MNTLKIHPQLNEKKEDNVPQLLGFLSNYNKIFTNQKAERKDLRYQDVRLWLFCMSPLKLHFLISCLVFCFLFFRIARFLLSSPVCQWLTVICTNWGPSKSESATKFSNHFSRKYYAHWISYRVFPFSLGRSPLHRTRS